MQNFTLSKVIVVGLIATAFAGVAGFCGGMLLTRPQRSELNGTIAAAVEKAKAPLRLKIAKLKKHTGSDIQKEIKDARAILLLQQGKMHELYPELSPYKAGENVVNRKYLQTFTVSSYESNGRNKITVNMSNNLTGEVKPDFKIYFLDKSGFIVGQSTMVWLINTIKQGETRTDTTSVSTRAVKRARYYFVNFD